MRRKTQRLLVNAVLFSGTLILILFLNRQDSTRKTLAWTEVRYKTTSSTLPKARGGCPGLAGSEKPALVVARVTADGDSSWLEELADLYHLCIYTADAPWDEHATDLQVPANRGHEAMAYLTFLIDNYAEIPTAGAVFVHGSRWAWHNDAPDYDNAHLLATLNVSAALAPRGYHNMRCDWSASTCPPSSAPQGSLETSLNAMLEPWNARAVSDAGLPRALATIFGGNGAAAVSPPERDGDAMGKGEGGLRLGRTHALRAQCCAQFVVARDSVRKHSREEYVALRQWLLDGSSGHDSTAAPGDDRIAGRILSYIWHVLFIQPIKSSVADASTLAYRDVDLEQLNTAACPRADDCYCRLYGRCNLRGCTDPGHCQSQYILPQDYRLPENWAATHT